MDNSDKMTHTVRDQQHYNACRCKHCKVSTAARSRKTKNTRAARRKLKRELSKEAE